MRFVISRKTLHMYHPALSLQDSDEEDNRLQTLISSARPFLRGELHLIDSQLPSLISVLRSVGAGECWHKHGTFLEHLVDIYRILKIWKAPDSVCLCGLFHSAYSNSYVNLAIFDPHVERQLVRRLVGGAAERLIHLFCIVPRQSLIHDDLIFKYRDTELVEHVMLSKISLKNAKEKRVFDAQEPWRKKLNLLLPADGILGKHIKSSEDVVLTRRVVGIFLLITMADFSDQFFGFQDDLFDNQDGRLEFIGSNSAFTLWPGEGKPGLWMNSLSKMGAVYVLIRREEEIFMEERRCAGGLDVEDGRDEDLELVVPPVFENCSKILDASEQVNARDLYWEGVCGDVMKSGLGRVEELMLRCMEGNPFVGEPHIALSQVYLSYGLFEEAEMEAKRGLTLLLEWGSAWDKRMSWEGWVAWGRILLMKSKEKSWPQTSWGVLNLGLVR